jgi:NADH/NAD ratio-sensing transcriptional regulator Rex
VTGPARPSLAEEASEDEESLEGEHVGRNVEVSCQFANVVPVQGTPSLENFGNRGIGYSRRAANLSLRNALGFDQMSEHFRVGDWGHGVSLTLVSLDQVAKNLQIILFFQSKVSTVEKRIDHFDSAL